MRAKLSLFLIFTLVFPILLTLSASALELSAKSAILIEAESGTVLYQKNAFVRMPMASTTKIMTAIVAIEEGDLEKTVTVSDKAIGVEGSSIYLLPKERLTLEELVYALLLQSANDAATAIAIEVGGSVEGFADMMNEKAEALGLTATHFENPHGLDHEDHYTTAYDLAKITAYALGNKTFRDICSTYKKTIPHAEEGTRVLVNHNKLLRLYDGAIGVKTGFTKRSGRCLVGAATRDGLTLVSVTLSAPDDWNDHARLLDFGFDRYERVTLAEGGTFTATLPIAGGTAESITVRNRDAVSVMLPRAHGEITHRIEAARPLLAPVSAGETLGRVVWLCDGKEIASSPLVTVHAVTTPKERFSFFDWLFSLFDR